MERSRQIITLHIPEGGRGWGEWAVGLNAESDGVGGAGKGWIKSKCARLKGVGKSYWEASGGSITF